MDPSRPDATPFLSSGWPWWWILIPLLLLLLLILLCCLLLWLLQGQKRRRERRWVNGQEPLIREDKYETRYRGDFEEGYRSGFDDASRLGSGAAARERMDHEYSSRTDRFHEGYAKAIRDAGLSGMTSSMYNLAHRPNQTGYSAGYMQGFRDGNSGVFGDRITTSLLKRLEEQYPNNDEFRTGYVDGFKDGVGGGRVSLQPDWQPIKQEFQSFEESRHIQKSLTELTERITSLEKTKGDEIHSTKIYHVYNQHPDFAGYTSTGQQLASELEELTGGSRRSTLRRHYTPGDYVRYQGELDGYNSLGRNRRSLSASALGRDAAGATTSTSTGAAHQSSSERQRHASNHMFSEGAADQDRIVSESYSSSRRYNYRSRSDVDNLKRYASQTLLDGARPGPITPHARRDALHSLQRELDSLSRSPDAAARSTGYASDSGGYQNDTIRSRTQAGAGRGGISSAEYGSFQNLAHSEHHRSGGSALNVAEASGFGGGGSSSYLHRYGGEETNVAHNWADDLIVIVHEPMNQTLDRMRRFSNSLSNVNRSGGAGESGAEGMREQVEERYQRSYKEEYSHGGQQQSSAQIHESQQSSSTRP